MKRWHLFELGDQDWFPNPLRSLITDLLQYQLTLWGVYKLVVPELKKLMCTMNCDHIIDLCSGGGGALLQIQETLAQEGHPVSITLTDRYPNIAAFEKIRQHSGNRIDFRPEPVDATSVPKDLKGVRTLFTSFHHFKPTLAKNILQNMVDSKAAIGVFEFTERKPANVIKMILVSPILVLCQTPFVRPFKWSRLFWTYLIPLVPFIYLWDAMVSHMRTYSTEDLQNMVSEINNENYHWKIDKLALGKLGISVTCLIGHPDNRIQNDTDTVNACN
jgi:hypothetical protein